MGSVHLPSKTIPSNGRQLIFAGLKERSSNGFDAFPQKWGIGWNLFFDLTGNKESWALSVLSLFLLLLLNDFVEFQAAKSAHP